MNTMKFCVAFFSLLLTLTAVSSASGQTVHYDSLAVDSMLPSFNPAVLNPTYAEDFPNGTSAQFMGDGEIDGMRFIAGDSSVVMQKDQRLEIYWKIGSIVPGDSNIAQIHLQRVYDDKLYDTAAIFYVIEPNETNEINVEGMKTIIVPDTGYNSISVNVASNFGGNSFWLDAITLVQSGTAGVSEQLASREAVLASYPNPFEHSSRVAVHIDAPASGRGELLISDALGREVERVPIGELQPGGQDVSLAMNQAGIFFARLLIDGTPVGPPLKLVAE